MIWIIKLFVLVIVFFYCICAGFGASIISENIFNYKSRVLNLVVISIFTGLPTWVLTYYILDWH